MDTGLRAGAAGLGTFEPCHERARDGRIGVDGTLEAYRLDPDENLKCEARVPIKKVSDR
jgi:hypothetical protein